MAKNDTYHPNYKRLYPDVEISSEIISTLQKSDRKMKYIEVELKKERFIHSQKAKIAEFLPSREASYDRMLEEQAQFPSDDIQPEDKVIHNEEIHRLRTALLELTSDEAASIHALFYEGLSERQLSKRTGVPQRTIHDRKKKILVKLHKLLEN